MTSIQICVRIRLCGVVLLQLGDFQGRAQREETRRIFGRQISKHDIRCLAGS
jgi:hypothetical protein